MDVEQEVVIAASGREARGLHGGSTYCCGIARKLLCPVLDGTSSYSYVAEHSHGSNYDVQRYAGISLLVDGVRVRRNYDCGNCVRAEFST